MAKKWQIVEREGVMSSWSIPRTSDTIQQFTSKEDALKVAKDYVTQVNMDNALTSGEKEKSAEMFLIDDTGVFLGVLDGKPYYVQYKQDEWNQKRTEVLHKKGDIVKDSNYYELDKKGEVAVREVPGT